MPQINSGKSPPWVSGEIVTAAELNGMIDSATINPSVITDQTNFTTLTGDEYALVVDNSGLLKKTQVKNIVQSGSDVVTDNINALTINGTLLISANGTNGHLALRGGNSGTSGLVSTYAKDVVINASGLLSDGSFTVTAGTGGISFNSGNTAIEFLSKVELNTTNAVRFPIGTTAQRPATPVAGDTRFNSTTSKLEFYNGTAWTSCVDNATGSISTGLLLYDVYEEVGTVVSGGLFTKPVGEIWIVEIQTSYYAGNNNGSPHMKFPTYSSTSEDIFLGATQGWEWITFRKVYGTATTLTSQTFGLWHWTGNVPNYHNGCLRIYKYRPA